MSSASHRPRVAAKPLRSSRSSSQRAARARDVAAEAAPCERPEPVPVRARHDGWTPMRQLGFIDALAACGCVAEAAASVGMSRQAAYALRARPEAQQFRLAWDAALDLAVRLITDACFSRALHGEPVPHYYQGQQVGEHRRYDNRLAMFILRYRDPLRYAATLDQMVYSGHPEHAGVAFGRARNRLLDEAHDSPVVDDEPAGLPWSAEPVAQAAQRHKERAIIEGAGPIHGNWERRDRLARARAEHRRADTLRDGSRAG